MFLDIDLETWNKCWVGNVLSPIIACKRFTHNLAKETRPCNVATIILDPGFSVTERMEAETFNRGGIALTGGHSPDVPGVAARYLCTCADPMVFNGKMVYSPDFVLEHGLMRALPR